MKNRRWMLTLLALFAAQALWAEEVYAPAVPDLSLPAEEPVAAAPVALKAQAPAVAPAAVEKPAPAKKTSRRRNTKRAAAPKRAVPPVTAAAARVNSEDISVENLMPPTAPAPRPAAQAAGQTPVPLQAPAAAPLQPVASLPAAGGDNQFVPARETQPAAKTPAKKLKVSFNPSTDRDPTLSPDDTLLLKHREEERLRAIELERQRKIEAERRRLAELERQRQLELERLRDPSREVRGKIRVNGIIGQEVFIGSKVYTVGKSVHGARIVQVLPDAVVFMYKGQKFTKKVQLK